MLLNSLESSTPEFESASVIMPALQATETKFALVHRLVDQVRDQLDLLEQLLEGTLSVDQAEEGLLKASDIEHEAHEMLQGRILDGVFDGEHMVGENGKQYVVPPNYASKSKLVEGDLLRLTIHHAGRFIYKQKGPIERQRMVGMLSHDDQTNVWFVNANGSKYRILGASISFFKGQEGDEVVVLVPKNTPSRWAAVENIIHRTSIE